ncbi:MAG: adenylate/guanylate cyclase domain-containing protein [Solirubrobacterales bacterium]
MRLPREQLLQFLSPATADAVLASPEDLLRGRRLEVSVLCCDVADFRALAESDPEAALDSLNLLLAAIARAILARDGALMSFPGDGALAVFGAPIAGDDHRDRATDAEAEISGPLLATVNRELGERGDGPLEIRTAVRSGPVVAGAIGATPRWEFAAIGAATSRAVAEV